MVFLIYDNTGTTPNLYFPQPWSTKTTLILSHPFVLGGTTENSCQYYDTVVIPNTVTKLGCFWGWTNLARVSLPNSITELRGTFYGCSSLDSIVIPNSVDTIISAFIYCTGLTTITIPDSTRYLGWSAFSGCSGLHTVTLGRGLRSIDYSAFGSGCQSINTIYYNADSCTITDVYSDGYDYYPFNNWQGLKKVYFGNNVRYIPQGIFYNTGIDTLIIPESVIEIGKNAFSSCDSLQYVSFPNTIRQIGERAFCGCSNLQEITLPHSLTTIKAESFRACSSLQKIIIPNSVTKIEQYSFEGCTGLRKITIGNSVASIYTGAFWGCTSIDGIFCLPQTPPNVLDAFRNIDFSVPVIVPCNTIESYQAAAGWSSFTNIHEDCNMAISDVDYNINVIAQGNQLIVNGTADSIVTLYDATGRTLAIKQSGAQTITFDVPATGTYLVKVGNAPARRIVVVRK